MSTKKEIKLKGVAAAPGLAISEAFFYKKEKEIVKEEIITNTEDAIEALTYALERSKKELKKVLALAIDKIGDKRAAIFEAQIMILDDPVLIDNIFKRIENEKKSAEFIVHDEISKYQKLITASADSDYMKERSQDIDDIKNRIIRNIRKKRWKSKIGREVIVVTDTLTPADTILFSKEKVKGFVTDYGGLTSHAAILARSLNIPAVLGLHHATSKIEDKDTLIIDGFHGEVIVNPTEDTINLYLERIKKLEQFDEELKALKDLPAVTKDGIEVEILANLDIAEELEISIENGASGVGLVRTEQIIEGYDSFPSEDEQYQIYKKLAERIYPNPITIRVLDIGGDKVLPVDVKEPNPMLGWRGIRFLNDNLDLYKTQIRALLKASSSKNIRILIPMITSIYEIRKAKEIIEECKEELRKEEIFFDEDIEMGIMIEVPSAAVMANVFSEEVDFISIGTNDLIQYLLAVDRGNDIISNLYQEFHPAVIRLLNFIINNTPKKKENSISLCGEMGADPLAIPLLVGLGLRSISLSAVSIPTVKKIIRNINYSDVKLLAEECLQLKTENEIKERVKNFYSEKLKGCVFDFD